MITRRINPLVQSSVAAAPSPETFSECIERIYDAAAAPHLWETCLEALSDLLGGLAVMLHLRFPEHDHNGVAVAYGVSAKHLQEYGSNYYAIDPWLGWACDLPPGTVTPVHELIEPTTLARSVFFREWMRPQRFLGNCLIAALLLRRGEAPLATLHLCRPWGGQLLDVDPIPTLRALMPHLQRAVVVHHRLTDSEAQCAAANAALDRMPFAYVLVDARGRVVFVNESAKRILSTADGVRLSHTGLAAVDPRDDAQLRSLIRSAASAPQPRGSSFMTVSRNRGEPLIVQIERLSAACQHRGERDPLVGVYLGDPQQRTEINVDELRRLFGLTPAESRLARLVGQGKRLDEAASQLGVSPQTARAQLKQVFGKTGVTRQAELVRLLLSSPLWSPPAL